MIPDELYGARGSAVGDFTDNELGKLRVALDQPGYLASVTHFPPEREPSVYGHGQTVIRCVRHFQKCLDHNMQPAPGVLDGARSVAVAAAAWESADTGRPVRVVQEFA